MEKLIINKDFSVHDFKRLITLLHQYGGIAYTRQLAADYINTAKNALAVFDNSEAKEILLMIADYALARKG
jgi:geranylgeranyl pyrophosphate synthase